MLAYIRQLSSTHHLTYQGSAVKGYDQCHRRTEEHGQTYHDAGEGIVTQDHPSIRTGGAIQGLLPPLILIGGHQIGHGAVDHG